MWTTRYQTRDPGAVLDEMESAVERYQARNFDFYDLTAVLKRDWIEEFCRRLIERKLDVSWQIPSGTRTEALTGEVPRLMFAAGCRNLSYAPESGSPSMIERIRKRVDLGKMKASMRLALEAGLKVKCNIIVGFPDETAAELAETAAFCRELAWLGLHDIYVAVFSPYPGSELFGQLRQSGKIPRLDDDYYDQLAASADLSRTVSFCEQVPAAGLHTMRWRTMAEFYGISFARRPRRFAELVANLARGRQTTRLQKSFTDMARRHASSWFSRGSRS
jgi:radical SAM superfamily enzyme YgiQ (UPF0313 family)